MRRRLVCALAVAALAAPAAALARSGDDVAALQVRLRELRLYTGPVSGVESRATVAAVVALQRRAGIAVDGIVGPQTRRALGAWAERPLGARRLGRGNIGWDVAALQFALAWHGFPSGRFDGVYATHVQRAVRRFQRWAGLPATGAADRATIAAAQGPLPVLPIRLSRPIDAPVGDGFGPRGLRFHTGLDFPAPLGTPVAAAAPGRVTWAGDLAGGWGITVTIAHGDGVRTLYAHLESVAVEVGQRVAAGQTVGAVGATGDATGPHLHFEARLRGAAVDPMPALAP